MVLGYPIRWISAAACILASAGCFADGDTPLHIKIPKELDPKKAMIRVFQSGAVIAADWTETGGFAAKVNPDAKMVQVLVYYPGYQLMTFEYSKENMQEEVVFEPEFVKLSMVPVDIKLVTSDGAPVVGRKVTIKGSSTYIHVFKSNSVNIPEDDFTAQGITDKDGIIHTELPNQVDDRIRTNYSQSPPNFRLSTEDWGTDVYGYRLVPPYIVSQKRFDGPVIIRNIYCGRITGKAEDSFFKRNGVVREKDQFIDKATGRKCEVWLFARRNGSGSGTGLQRPDGSFMIDMEPGKWDLTVEIREDRKILKTIPIEKDYMIAERQKKVYFIK